MRKFPFGIVAGICAMLSFFGIAGFAASYIVLNGVAGQVNSGISLFEYPWQIALFIFDIIFVLGFLSMFAMWIYRTVKYPYKEAEDENV